MDSIVNFNSQFEFNPKINNENRLITARSFVVVGMGGSHLSADLVKMWNPNRRMFISSDYGIPNIPRDILEKSLIIAHSYSGNTEEVLSSFEEIIDAGYALSAITVGGELVKKAVDNDIPYILIPDTGISPRMALGYGVISLLSLMRDLETLPEIRALSSLIRPKDYEEEGKRLADVLLGKMPVIYSSCRNSAIAYNWKIKFNENTKIPAYCGYFPEVNHNEISGYDSNSATRNLSKNVCAIFMVDRDDDSRIKKRMEITRQLYDERGISSIQIDIEGLNQYHKTFSSILLADWISFYLASLYGTDPVSIPMIDALKERMS